MINKQRSRLKRNCYLFFVSCSVYGSVQYIQQISIDKKLYTRFKSLTRYCIYCPIWGYFKSPYSLCSDPPYHEISEILVVNWKCSFDVLQVPFFDSNNKHKV